MVDTRFKKGMIPWNRKIWLKKVCPKCDREFSVKPSLARIVCCSKRCSRLGVTTSDKQKEVAKKIGLQSAKWMLGRVPWNKGKKHPIVSGSNHYLWKEDRTKLKTSEKKHLDSRYREWMFAVKNRDEWKCRIADSNCKGRLEAHHILNWKEYPELRYQLNNGITLCHAHHPRKRSDEAKLSPFFQGLVAKMN